MRNLKLQTGVCVKGLKELESVQTLRVDYDTGNVFFVTRTHLVVVDIHCQKVVAAVALCEEGFLPTDGSCVVVGVEHLPDQQSLCVAISSGNVILWNPSVQQVDCVGSVDGGLTGMGWSPDQEVVAFTTGKDTLLLMTREFEPITETSLYQAEFGEAAFVNVGWGKKETQFHGSAGKSAAAQVNKDMRPVFVWDDRYPRISWRGDGQFFVINSVCPTSDCRQLRVWSRSGYLHSTSELVDGLEQALAWRPSGNLIAATQRSTNKHEIIFYEKNGLRHGEFMLPFNKEAVKVCELLWNVDSSILAVLCEDIPSDGNKPNSYVQLWTVNNYHWYLKQSLHFNSSSQVVSVQWDLEQACRLHIVTAEGEYLCYTWSWATNHSTGNSPDDQTSVAVIDGDKVLITPMRKMVVPPPMSAYYLQLSSAVNQVVFAPPPFTNDVAVILVDGQVAVFKLREGERSEDGFVKTAAAGGEGFSVSCDVPKLQDIYSLEDVPENAPSFPMALSQFLWVSPDLFILCGVSANSRTSVLYQAEMAVRNSARLVVRSHVEVEGLILNMVCSPFGGDVAVQLTDGTVLRLDPVSMVISDWTLRSGELLCLPQPCSQIQITEFDGEEVLLGLSERFRFYVNNMELCSNCTSFAVHDEFILLTTLTHTCRCISKNTAVEDLPALSGDKSHPFDESIRRIERGAQIVAVVPEDTKLILQMPRGNLETIHPRALVLSAVRTALDRLEFLSAFTLMKKHRINLNLIFDHNPQAFLTNVHKFLTQIKHINNINIFITELQEEDVTLTMYTAAYKDRKPQFGNGTDRSSKVDTVCDTVRSTLVDMDQNKYLLSILTTYVKKSSPELESALGLIRKLRDVGEDNLSNSVSAEEALKYLLFLVDVNELYDVALGTYDFDLVLMVAEKSQKDPKEYLPFLNNLRRLEDDYQKYTIDRLLKRHHRALSNIAKCPDKFNECLTLVEEEKLFREAMELFPKDSQQYKDIAVSCGKYLEEKKCYDEAGVMFVKADEAAMALQSFEKSHNWRQALCMAALLKMSPEEQRDLSLRLAETLRERRDFSSAAIIYEHYLQDIEEAIVVLIEGQMWEESLRLMYKYRRTDFMDTNFRSALSERHSQMLTTLNNMRTEFEHHTARLATVREKKEKARLEYQEVGGTCNDGDSDLFSDGDSAAGESVQSRVTTDSQRSTVISRSTGRSSRNRRKLERKKWSLKEGSPHEDLALIEALSKLITFVDNLRGEISPLMKMLVQFDQETEAKEIQESYDHIVKMIQRSIPEIWIPEQEPARTELVLGPGSTANSIAEAMQSGQFVKPVSLLDPVLKTPPQFSSDSHWKMRILEL